MATMEITAVRNCPTLIRGETVAAGETRTVEDCYYWREQVRNGSVLPATQPEEDAQPCVSTDGTINKKSK